MNGIFSLAYFSISKRRYHYYHYIELITKFTKHLRLVFALIENPALKPWFDYTALEIWNLFCANKLASGVFKGILCIEYESDLKSNL